MSSNLEIILCSVFLSPIWKVFSFFSSHIALEMTTKDQHTATSRNNSRICLAILPRLNLVENLYQMEKSLCLICRREYSWGKKAFLRKMLLQSIRQTFPALWIVQVLRAVVPTGSRKVMNMYVNSLTSKSTGTLICGILTFFQQRIFYLETKNILFSPLLTPAACIASLIGSCSIDVQKRTCFEHTSRVSCLTKETISSWLLWREPGTTEHLFHCSAGQNTAGRKDSDSWNCNTLIFMFSVHSIL